MPKGQKYLRVYESGSLQSADPESSVVLPSVNSALAQRVLHSRLERARLFGPGLFADPAYDILLYLFIKSETGELVSIGKVCVAADVPEPTAFRYVRMLAEKGYLERMAHPHDKRIVHLKLSAGAIEKLTAWLARFGAALNEESAET